MLLRVDDTCPVRFITRELCNRVRVHILQIYSGGDDSESTMSTVEGYSGLHEHCEEFYLYIHIAEFPYYITDLLNYDDDVRATVKLHSEDNSSEYPSVRVSR